MTTPTMMFRPLVRKAALNSGLPPRCSSRTMATMAFQQPQQDRHSSNSSSASGVKNNGPSNGIHCGNSSSSSSSAWTSPHVESFHTSLYSELSAPAAIEDRFDARNYGYRVVAPDTLDTAINHNVFGLGSVQHEEDYPSRQCAIETVIMADAAQQSESLYNTRQYAEATMTQPPLSREYDDDLAEANSLGDDY